jgi:class 3 adenylate cyclase
MSKIRESRGDLCRVTGDGMLVEFASAVDAVTFAANRNDALVLRNNEH